MKITELINLGSSYLKNNKILSSRIDSEIILSHVMGISRERLLIGENYINKEEADKFNSLILRRSRNEPIAYITKNKEFRSTNFFVNKNSLIPRPETELIIDPLVEFYKNKNLYFLDVGIGTGCISFSILNNNSFILVGFHKVEKLNLSTINCWITIMSKIENSYLWLKKPNKIASKNLIDFFEAENIDSSRLIFISVV